MAASIYFFDLFAANSWQTLFMNINLCLGAFNLLPALPLDGGRVLQAILSGWVGIRKAVKWTALLGKVLGLGMAASGVYFTITRLAGVNVLLVGIFLVWAAHREEKLLGYAFMRFLVRKKKELSESGFLPTRPLVGTAATAIKDILATASPASYLIVLLIDEDNRVAAIKSEVELINLLLEKGPHCRLSDFL